MSGSAIDPYGGSRHTLSDPRDDDHSTKNPNDPPFRSRLVDRDSKPLNIPAIKPPTPCRLSRACSKSNHHLGDCDKEATWRLQSR